MTTPRINAVDSEQWIIIGRSAAPIVTPLDLLDNVIASILLPGNAMGPNGIVRVSAHWTCVSNANSKNIRARFGVGGATLCNANISNQTQFKVQSQVHNRGALNSQFVSGGSGGGWNTTVESVTAALNTAIDQQIQVTCQKAVGADAVTLESYLVELLQGA